MEFSEVPENVIEGKFHGAKGGVVHFMESDVDSDCDNNNFYLFDIPYKNKKKRFREEEEQEERMWKDEWEEETPTECSSFGEDIKHGDEEESEKSLDLNFYEGEKQHSECYFNGLNRCSTDETRPIGNITEGEDILIREMRPMEFKIPTLKKVFGECDKTSSFPVEVFHLEKTEWLPDCYLFSFKKMKDFLLPIHGNNFKNKTLFHSILIALANVDKKLSKSNDKCVFCKTLTNFSDRGKEEEVKCLALELYPPQATHERRHRVYIYKKKYGIMKFLSLLRLEYSEWDKRGALLKGKYKNEERFHFEAKSSKAYVCMNHITSSEYITRSNKNKKKVTKRIKNYHIENIYKKLKGEDS